MVIITLKILIIAISTACFLSLAVYAWLAFNGDSLILYSTVDSRLLSTKQNIFLGLAAVGFLVCMYQGAAAMLFWLPESWGSIDADGDYQTVRSSLAGVFTLFVGLAFLVFIDKATHEKFFLREFREKSEALERIIEASSNETQLDYLRNNFEKRIEALEANAKERGAIANSLLEHLLPEGRRIFNYSQLISIIEDQKGKLSNA